MGHAVDEVVLPVLDKFALHYDLAESRQAVRLGFGGESGDYELFIKEVERPPLLWFRFDAHLYLPHAHAALAETVLGKNAGEFLLKWGRVPTTGELVCDLELPLLDHGLSSEAFVAFFLLANQRFQQSLPLLAKVRWGALSAEEALQAKSHLRPKPEREGKGKRRRMSQLEREIDALLDGLGSDDAAPFPPDAA